MDVACLKVRSSLLGGISFESDFEAAVGIGLLALLVDAIMWFARTQALRRRLACTQGSASAASDVVALWLSRRLCSASSAAGILDRFLEPAASAYLWSWRGISRPEDEQRRACASGELGVRLVHE
jgi:hypothetical protein